MCFFKKIFSIAACIFLCITIVVSVKTYAKYLSSANGNASINIAKWDILVNNLSIKNNTDISSVITPYFPGNDNISNGVVAPNAEGYFDLNFNFTNVDVSFEYNITVSPDEQSTVKDIVATSYSIDDGEIITFDNNQSLIKVIELVDKPSTQKVRIYIKWIDNENAHMNDTDDTQAAISNNPVALINVTVSFKQLAT